MLQQIGSPIRRLWRQPAFALTAIGTLALGIAAPTALFTVVNATLLKPLPYTRPGEIHAVKTAMTDGRFTIGLVGTEELTALKKTTPAVTATTWAYPMFDTVGSDSRARQVAMFGVPEGFFGFFGGPMTAGRDFTVEDRRSRERRIVLSHRLWTSTFGADPAIVGQRIQMGSMNPLVIGVAASTFDVPHDADAWLALDLEESIGHMLLAYTRLQPGVTPAALDAPVAAVFRELAKKYPDQETNRTFVSKPLLTAIVGDLGPTVLIAFAAAGLLLLLALVNVASLLLARGTARTREMSVRAALGATRWQLMRQLLAEALWLSCFAAVVGMALAYAAVRALTTTGASYLPRVDGIRFDPWVFVFTAFVTLVVGVLVAVLPALALKDVNLVTSMNEGGRAAMQGRSTRRWLNAMVVGEVALAVALVAGAGRLLLSLNHLLAIDPGFRADGRLIVDALLPAARYARDPQMQVNWTDEADAAIRAMGATHVGVASTLPMRHEWDTTIFTDIVGHPVDPQRRPNGRLRRVNAEFFDTVGISVRAGRGLSAADRAGSAAVVVVNESWVRKFADGADPLQLQMLGPGFGHRTDRGFVSDPAAIVGVVSDAKYADVMNDAEPVVYASIAQLPFVRRSLVVTTADGHPERLVPGIRAALTRIDPQVAFETDMMSSSVSMSLTWSRLGLFLMATFGAMALVLSGVGVFGVIAFVVAQRRGEMAVRLALGATPQHLFNVVLTQGGRFVVAGALAGLVTAWAMGQWMTAYVYHVNAANAVVLGGSAAIVLLVAFAAMLLPARGAAAVSPSSALR